MDFLTTKDPLPRSTSDHCTPQSSPRRHPVGCHEEQRGKLRIMGLGRFDQDLDLSEVGAASSDRTVDGGVACMTGACSRKPRRTA